jgi:orotate phosphoribosyltransferase
MMKSELMKRLYEIGAIKFGEFTLKSGKKSPYYVDLRILSSYPDVLRQVGKVMGEMILADKERPDVICGIPAAGLAIANAISLEFNIPAIYTKKEPIIYKELAKYLNNLLNTREEGGFSFDLRPGIEEAIRIIESLSGLKVHGIPRYVDGDFKDGARIGIVDDLITTAESKLEARDLILLDAKRRNINVSVVGVYVLLDREQGGREALEREGLKLRSVATITEAVKWLYELKLLDFERYKTIIDYVAAEKAMRVR